MAELLISIKITLPVMEWDDKAFTEQFNFPWNFLSDAFGHGFVMSGSILHNASVGPYSLS